MDQTLNWIKAAGIRAIKTFAQSLASAITIGSSFGDISWTQRLSIAGVAFIFSLVTSLGGLPELKTDGVMTVNMSDPSKDVYSLELNKNPDTLAEMRTVTFTVKK